MLTCDNYLNNAWHGGASRVRLDSFVSELNRNEAKNRGKALRVVLPIRLVEFFVDHPNSNNRTQAMSQTLHVLAQRRRDRMLSGLFNLGIVLACVLTLTGCSGCRPQDAKSPIRIGYMQVSTGLPLFVALEQNMFQDEGLEVEAIQFESVNQAMDAMLTGRIDGIQGVGFTTFIAVEQNATGEFKLFWTCAETKKKFSSGFLKRKGAPYTVPAELRGKRIGTYTGTTQLINLEVVLQNLGIDPKKDVEIIQVGRELEVQAFAQGHYDFLFTIEPNVAIAIDKGIAEPFIENPRVKYIHDPFVAGGAVVSEKFVRERSGDLHKLVKVADRAIDFIRGHEQQAKSYLTKYTPISEDIAQRSGMYEFWKLGQEDRDAMQALADLYFRTGVLKSRVDTPKMILGDESMLSSGER
jgi:NitT/TauT family transport system substrate-binding protein